MVQPCNQIIDTIFTGKAFGAYALQAYALFLPVNSFLIAVSCVLSKGTQISCSHLIGRGRLDNAKELVGTAILTGLSVSVAFSLIMIFFPERAAVLLGASPDVTNQIEYTAGYLCAYAYGVPAMIILDTLMCLMQLEGKKRIVVGSSLCVLVVNLTGDIANIYVFKRGITGMAMATALANTVAAVVIIIYICRNSRLFCFTVKGAKKSIYSIS